MITKNKLRFKKCVFVLISGAYASLNVIHMFIADAKNVLYGFLVLSLLNFADNIYGSCLDAVKLLFAFNIIRDPQNKRKYILVTMLILNIDCAYCLLTETKPSKCRWRIQI